MLALWPLYQATLYLLGRYGPDPVDFAAYYHAALRYRRGYPLYELSTSIPEFADMFAANMAYLYSPLVILMVLPFTLLPLFVAATLWDIVGYLCLLGSLLVLLRSLDVTLSTRQGLVLGWLLFGYAPVLYSLYLGQITVYLVAVVCLTGAAIEHARSAPENGNWEYLAGATLPLAVVVKPYYAAVGAVFVRDRRRIAGALTSITVLGVFTVLLFDPATLEGYLGVLQEGKGWGRQAPSPSNWETGVYRPLHLFGGLRLEARLLWVVGVALLSAYSAVFLEEESADRYVFALGVISISVVLPEPNPLVLATPLPALVVLYVTERRRDGPFQLLPLVALGCYHLHDIFVQVVGKYLPAGFAMAELVIDLLPILQPGLWGTVIVAGLVLYRLWTDPHTRGAPTTAVGGN